MDLLSLDRAGLIGWSDGAVIALMVARQHPKRVSGVFFFACNMDPSGTREFEFTPIIGRCFSHHKRNYVALSSTSV